MRYEQWGKKTKEGLILINTSRGEIIDEDVLYDLLKSNHIYGAGLDVFEQEPPDPENPLLHIENVISTPHVASASQRMAPETRRRVGKELSLVLTGRWPRSCVNPAVLADSGLKRWQPYSMGRGPGSG